MKSASAESVSFFSPDSHSEPERKLFAVAAQQELALTRKPQSAGISDEIVRSQKSAGAALALACHASGLEDKEVYMALEIGASHFSEMKSGKKHFPADKINALCDVVGNRIYPEWIAAQVGCGLHLLQTEAERRIAQLEAENERKEHENRLMRQLIQGK